MNKLILTFLMSLLLSCSSNTLKREITQRNEDVLANEALYRYDLKRKANMLKSNSVKLLGITHCHNNDHDRGLDFLKSQFNKNKNDPEYWNHIGNCYYLINNYPKAIFYYHLSISTSKKVKKLYFPAYNNLGIIYLKLGLYNDALSSFEQAVKANSSMRTPKFNLAQLYLKFGLYNKALSLLKKLYRLAPGDREVISSIGIAYLMTNDLSQAISYFKKIPAKDFSRKDIASYYALALYLDGKIHKAKEVLSLQESVDIPELNYINNKLNELIELELQKRG